MSWKYLHSRARTHGSGELLPIFICYASMATYAFSHASVPGGSRWADILFLSTLALRLVLDRSSDSLSISLNTALIYLFLIPNVTLYLDGNYKYVVLCATSMVIFDAIRVLSKDKFVVANQNAAAAGRLDFAMCVILVFLSLVNPFLLPPGEVMGLFRFVVPFGLSLVYFDRVCQLAGRRGLIALLGLYGLSILSFVIFHWGGFGRIVIGAYIMMPLLMAAHHRGVALRTWQAAMLAPPALLLGQISRYGEGHLANLHAGSASHHMVLTMQVLEMPQLSFARWGSYFDQWILFFLNWFPRGVWPEKPVGIGLYFVDEWIGRSGYSEGHSVSLGYLGEPGYLLGNWMPLGILISILTLVIVRRVIVGISHSSRSPVIVFDVMLISYVWGGYGTFGSRAWFFIIPMLMWVIAQRAVTGGRHQLPRRVDVDSSRRRLRSIYRD